MPQTCVLYPHNKTRTLKHYQWQIPSVFSGSALSTSNILYHSSGVLKRSETTDELDPLKGLTRLLTLGMDGRDMRVKAQESYSLWEEITGETPRELDWSSLVATLAFIY